MEAIIEYLLGCGEITPLDACRMAEKYNVEINLAIPPFEDRMCHTPKRGDAWLDEFWTNCHGINVPDYLWLEADKLERRRNKRLRALRDAIYGKRDE